MTSGIELIAQERQRQIDQEGYSADHDDHYGYGEIARAAACYATPPVHRVTLWLFENEDGSFRFAVPGDSGDRLHAYPNLWPWHPKSWRPEPEDRLKELAKAGALVAAEMDRILRYAASQEG